MSRATLALVTAVLASAICRWLLADAVADWGVDEAANVWLATQAAAGEGDALGLPSSLGIRNLAGAPVLGVPFTLLPDLLSISRALSLVHLAALAFLGARLASRAGSRWAACLILAGVPSLLLASFSFWNQYLMLPIGAAITGLLLGLLEERRRPAARAAAVAGIAALAAFEPTVHLAGFGNLAVNLLALGALPLLPDAPSPRFPRLRSALVRLGAVRGTAWVVPATLALLWAAGAGLSLAGALPARRLLAARDPAGLALAAAQAAVGIALLSAVLRCARDCGARGSLADALRLAFPSHAMAGGFLLGYATLLLGVRIAAAPTLLLPSGRCDLLVPLCPTLLAPLLLLGAPEARVIALRRAGFAAGTALVVAAALGVLGPSARYRQRYPHAVPPSEMAAAVDFVAAAHAADARESGRPIGPLTVDYDLGSGREWIARVAARQGLPWYRVGVPYDWLFRRRHGLDTIASGAGGARSGPGWRFRFVTRTSPSGAPPDTAGREFDRLEVRRTVPR